mgnify:CR=1 FL=1
MRARWAGESALARQGVRSRGYKALPLRLRRWLCPSDAPYHGWNVDSELSDLLIDCSPSLALRIMRLTRPPRVKSDADEKEGHRQEMLTRCYRAPGRRHRGKFPASVVSRTPPNRQWLARTYALKSRPPASMLTGVIP